MTLSLTLGNLLGANGFIDANVGIVALKISDFVDAKGERLLAEDKVTGDANGAQRFLAAYFAYLALNCKQVFNLTPEELLEAEPPDVGSLVDEDQAFVAQENQITDGFSFEKRNEVTQIRHDFIFSIYLTNTFKYDAGNAVGGEP
jgi:hypothetical protein